MPGVFKSLKIRVQVLRIICTSKFPLFLSLPACVSPFELTDGRGGGRCWGRSQILQHRESLTFYKPVNTMEEQIRHDLWFSVCTGHPGQLWYPSLHIPVWHDEYSGTYSSVVWWVFRYIFQCGMMSIQVHIPVWYDEYSGTYHKVVWWVFRYIFQ